MDEDQRGSKDWNQSNIGRAMWFLLQFHLCLVPLRVHCIENMTDAPAKNTTTESGPVEYDESTAVLLIVQIGMSFFFGGFVLPRVYRKCKKACMAQPLDMERDPETGEITRVCYLCNDKVAMSMWNAMEHGHRSQCALSHRELLYQLPKVNITCRKCTRNLRLWPIELGSNFECEENQCLNKGVQMESNGTNRLNCFICDYDMCSECAQEILQLDKEKTIKDKLREMKTRTN